MALFRLCTRVVGALLVLWTAVGSAEENTETVTTVECTTTAADEPFTVEVRQQSRNIGGRRQAHCIGGRGMKAAGCVFVNGLVPIAVGFGELAKAKEQAK